MKLFTKLQRNKLLDNGKPENQGRDHKPVVKLFMTNTNCTWLLTELDNESPNMAFGLCDLGLGFPEIGYVDLNELTELHSPEQFRFLERDLHFEACFPISVYARAASANEGIIENDNVLEKYIK